MKMKWSWSCGVVQTFSLSTSDFKFVSFLSFLIVRFQLVYKLKLNVFNAGSSGQHEIGVDIPHWESEKMLLAYLHSAAPLETVAPGRYTIVTQRRKKTSVEVIIINLLTVCSSSIFLRKGETRRGGALCLLRRELIISPARCSFGQPRVKAS